MILNKPDNNCEVKTSSPDLNPTLPLIRHCQEGRSDEWRPCRPEHLANLPCLVIRTGAIRTGDTFPWLVPSSCCYSLLHLHFINHVIFPVCVFLIRWLSVPPRTTVCMDQHVTNLDLTFTASRTTYYLKVRVDGLTARTYLIPIHFPHFPKWSWQL